MKRIRTLFQLTTVRKKVLLLSKLAGGSIVLFYLLTLELPTSRSVTFWIWFGLLMAVILGVDFLLGRIISKPLNEINNTAGQMAKLDFTAHCQVNASDEFGELSHSLNTMFANLQETLDKLETANVQLEADVERERQMLEERKELVDNLSHEMKTPLGLIRAYTEGLKDEQDEEKKKEYMEAILSATERMDQMIVSLLDLSALEAGAAKLSEEQFDFIELVETIAGRLLIDTPGAKYRFTYELPEQKVFIHADRQRIEQVLTNLIENAKKHVCEGGEIHLAVNCLDTYLQFSIFNQGAAIPLVELSKIWGKFYRGKNREQRGSGLGLAIVAQILSMYHVSYGVNPHTEGTEFFFQFPIKP